MHEFEEACDAVGCYIPVTGSNCKAGDKPDFMAITVADLQQRAEAKCFVTAEEASCCPSKPETCAEPVTDDTSGVKRGAALTGVMILLISAMQ